MLVRVINYISNLTNIGIHQGLEEFQIRRIKLVNTFSFIGVFLALFFIVINVNAGTYKHALLIATGIPLVSYPPILLNKLQKYEFGKNYFVIGLLLFANVVSFTSILKLTQRDNEYFLIVIATAVIILYDGYRQYFIYVIVVINAVLMKFVRFSINDVSIDSEAMMSFGNIVIAYIAVFVFSNAFKKDLLTSLKIQKKYSYQLEKNQKLIVQRNKELTEKEQLIRLLIDSVPIYLAMIDLEGRYVIVNSKYSEAYNLPINEFKGKHISEILPPSTYKSRVSLLEGSLKGKNCEFDDRVELPNGNILNAFGKYIPLFRNGEVFAILVHTTDVTTLKIAEQKLKQLNNTKNRLLSIISHDLRGPINSLKGVLELSPSLSQAELISLTKDISVRVDQLFITMSGMLNWVRSQFEGQTMQAVNVPVKNVLNNCLALYYDSIREKEIELIDNIGNDVVGFIDSESLNVALRNVISNAVKYTPVKGKVLINFSNQNDTIIIEVVNSGSGFENKEIDNFNNSNFFTSKEGTSGEKGAGIGLMICKDLLMQNNANLKISNNEGGESVVEITIPKGNV